MCSSDLQIFIDAHQAIMGGQSSFELHYRILRPSREVRHAFSQGEAMRDQNGNVIKLFGTTLDHTDRVLAEERVRGSEERLGLALEGSSDGFWDWNVVSGDCYFSPRIVEWLGFDPNEFEHHVKFWENLIHPDYLDVFNRSFQEHVANNTTHYEIEERIRTKSGAWIWVLSRGKFVQWHGALGAEHLKKMEELKAKKVTYKILICEGDYFFPAENFAEYRWLPKIQFSTVPFYVYGSKLAIMLFEDELKIKSK